MKKNLMYIFIAAGLSLSANAQSLDIKIGDVTYRYAAENTGTMKYSDGTTLTVGDKTYKISEINEITVTDETIDDGYVYIDYSGTKAAVIIAGNIAAYVDATVSGAHVSISQSKDAGEDTSGEISYRLQGESQDGSFYLDGSYKCSIELTGLSLTNPGGAVFDIQNGKRIAVRVKEGTVNTLVDGADGDQKGCIVCKGHLEFKQKGTLNVTGNASHAIYAKEYVEHKNTVLNITKAEKDGINCAQYYMIESGTLNISGTGDDGIQVEYKDDVDREDEDTGSITIAGGKLNISVSADAAKALKCEGNFVVTDGELTSVASGNGIWDDDKVKTKAAACIGVDGSSFIKGGTLNLTATGGGGKGISGDGELNVTAGEITVLTSGGTFAYVDGKEDQDYTGNTDRLDSDYKSSPKGIKIEGDITIEGGTFDITCSGRGGEGIESKSQLIFNGGDFKVRAYDDGVNSSSDTYVTGGNLDIMSIGNGDGLDSNGNIYISGGRMMIFGSRQPEQGFDVGDGYKIYFTGGEILAIGGGGNSVPSSSESTQPFLSLDRTVVAGETVSVSLDGTEIVSFIIPEDYSSANGNGNFFEDEFPGGGHRVASGSEGCPLLPNSFEGAPGGGGFGGMGGGGKLVISCPQLTEGTDYTVTVGNESVTATAQVTGGGR